MEGLFVRTTPAFVCAPPERRAEELTLEAVWPEDGAAVRRTLSPAGMTQEQTDRLLKADQPVGAGSMVELCW